ncbi:MAG TPA: proline dehydrogenase family protein [Acidimicrobiales bacterium]|nr:proline dehydrogenase family protein [Acidimicrobiales bacterium]
MTLPSEARVAELARQLAAMGERETSGVYRRSFVSDRMMAWAMARPAFRAQLFRFVDAFPAMVDDDDIARHLQEYFSGDAPWLVEHGVDVAAKVPFGRSVSAGVARRNIRAMAEQFIIGSTAEQAVDRVARMWSAGRAATVDVLGEKTVVAADADRYAARASELITALADAAPGWAPDDHLDHDGSGVVPRANLSVKPSALSVHYHPLSRAGGLSEAAARLRPILSIARDRGATVHFDMEHHESKDLTLDLFRQLLSEEEFAAVDAGVVVQAYRCDARDDLADLVAWSAKRAGAVPDAQPIRIRLVKGAYWDTETIRAEAAGWPSPVFAQKVETDANFERLVRILLDHHGEVRPVVGSHNLRSLAYTMAYAKANGIDDRAVEIQLLNGMAEPIHDAVVKMGYRLRVYCPVGELVPGMAYLVRRLLENTSNESFVRHRFAEGQDLDRLLAMPAVTSIPEPPRAARRADTDPADPAPYAPEPVREWHRRDVRTDFQAALDRLDRDLTGPGGEPFVVPAVVDGEAMATTDAIDSVDPACPPVVVARSASCGITEADRAIATAAAAAPAWRATPVAERAATLFRTASWFRHRRDELAALEVREAAKPWAQADADVCEAIDFCEYYAREMLRLDRGGAVQSPPGEVNELRYRGHGVAVVISPWNFPLAIPTGMTVAALVAGNPVVLKPAEQTPAIAARLVEALLASDVPPGVIGFVPGIGEVVGAHLVAHPDVATVAFTGSRAVGLAINASAAVHRAGQRHLKRVICELGGKNSVIVDSDADPDQVIPAVVDSAFAFAGQKCSALSRLIVHEAAWDAIVPRLVDAVAELHVGRPSDPETVVGPVIDAEAAARLAGVVDHAGEHSDVALHRADVPDGGWFVGPTVCTDVDRASSLWRDELFGPVLAVVRASSFDHALELANDTEYALTAGVFSRSPAHLALAAEHLEAGNVYLNRGITGAVVGRQPFGGFAMSGLGSKAGGPDYLLHFLDPIATSENTLRQGFAPEPASDGPRDSPQG